MIASSLDQGIDRRSPVANVLLFAHSYEMTPPKNIRPSEKLIGMRVRIRSSYATEAGRLFEAGGFLPIEHRDDGDVSFWFGKEPDEVLYRIATCIPPAFSAVQGVVVGKKPPFSS